MYKYKKNPVCTIASKINVTHEGDYLPISKLYSILAVTNLLAHNNISHNKSECCSLSDTFDSNIYFAGDGTSVMIIFGMENYECLKN